jgi:hypothetical protein
MKQEIRDELKDAIAELLWKRQGDYYSHSRCISIEEASASFGSMRNVTI